jgi:hypothetical protein
MKHVTFCFGLITTLAAPLAGAAPGPDWQRPAGESTRASAPARAGRPFTPRLGVMAGLAQWLLFRGGNLAVQLKLDRLVFEYSHGQGLELSRIPEIGLSDSERDAGIELGMPWTTGGGAGFQITRNLHALIELKAHRYRVLGADRNQELEYTTFTVGPGVFYDLYLYEGLYLQPSLRWWPTIGSTLDESRSALQKSDGTSYRHEPHALMPFVNVSIGWSFELGGARPERRVSNLERRFRPPARGVGPDAR